MAPTISVIIPTYNRAHCIGAAVASIQAQSLPAHEIIIVDDGSRDRSLQTLLALQEQDARIKIFHHGKNRGVSAARNTGIQMAEGDYITFLDSDDTWHPHKLAMQLAALEVMAPEQRATTFSLTNFQRVLDGHVYDSPIKQSKKPEEDYLTMRLHTHPVGTLMAHRDAIRGNGFYREGMHFAEDTEYVVRHIAGGGKLHYLPDVLMDYSYAPIKRYGDSDAAIAFIHQTHGPRIAARFGKKLGHTYKGIYHIYRTSRLMAQKQYRQAAWELVCAIPYAPRQVGFLVGTRIKIVSILAARKFKALPGMLARRPTEKPSAQPGWDDTQP